MSFAAVARSTALGESVGDQIYMRGTEWGISSPAPGLAAPSGVPSLLLSHGKRGRHCPCQASVGTNPAEGKKKKAT